MAELQTEDKVHGYTVDFVFSLRYIYIIIYQYGALKIYRYYSKHHAYGHGFV